MLAWLESGRRELRTQKRKRRMCHPLSVRWLLMVLLPLAAAGGVSLPGVAAEPATQPAGCVGCSFIGLNTSVAHH